MRKLFPDNAFVPAKLGTSRRLVVAEAPGEEESLKGEPLVGGAGRWFDAMCEKAGLKRDELTLTNIISCRPPDNIFPTDPDAKKYISSADAYKAVGHCYEHHLGPLLRSRNWTRVDLLGDKPLRFLADRTEGVFKWRGSPIAIPALGPEAKAIATLHPAYIMRDQEMLPVVINDLRKPLGIPPEDYNLYPSVDDVGKFVATEFAFDIETRGISNDISLVGLSSRANTAMVVPFRGAYIPQLQRIFRNAKACIGHNSIQFDLPILKRNGVTPGADCVLWDTMLMQHLCFPSLPHDLEFVGSQFCNKPAWKDDKVVYERYCARDTDVTLQAWQQLRPMLREFNLEKLYLNVQVPLAKICHLMHVTGFKVDPNHIEEARTRIIGQMEAEEKYLPEELRSYDKPIKRRQPAPEGTLGKSGKPLKYILVDDTERVQPWRSPDKKGQWLYGTLGFTPILDPKRETVTTGKNALDKLHRLASKDSKMVEAKIPRAIAALKSLNKWDELVTTFCKKEMLSVARMYPHFNVHGTASGRLSSSDPNLQNIPESTRFIYVPTNPGWRILEVDYSQIENRLTAYFAGDTERLERFRKNPKFSEHKFAASRFLNIDYDDVEKSSDPESPYIKAKKIVHGTNYGEGARKIALLNDLDYKEVKRLLDIWKNEIRLTIEWQARSAELAKKQGYLETPFGRRRWFYTASYYTESLSFLPQSTAADIVFRAMIALMYKRIGWPEERARQVVKVVKALPEPARLLLQVHDSLIFEYPPSIETELIETVQSVMEQPWPELDGFSCPIGIKVGDSWGEAEEWSPPVTQKALGVSN